MTEFEYSILHAITSLRKAAGTSVFCGELVRDMAVHGAQVSIVIVNPQEQDRYPMNPVMKVVAIADGLADCEVD